MSAVDMPEVRMSPGGGEIAQRCPSTAERPRYGRWLLKGGTNDGDWVEDAEVEDWTPLVPETVTVPLMALRELAREATLVASAFDDTIPPRELGKGQLALIAGLIDALGVEGL